MIEVSPLMVTGLMFGTMILLMITGLPLAMILGSVALIYATLLWGPKAVELVYHSALGLMDWTVLVALPLFLFMGIVLERSGIADDLYGMFHKLLGGINGGLAMGTVLICTLIAAMAGVSGAATVSMGIIALPAMLKRGYDKRITVGTIQAGGALGFLIPPSIKMIIFGLLAGVSVGRLYAGGILPGLMLATMYIIYIGIRCHFQPYLGPALPPEERVSWLEKVKSLKAAILPGCLIFAVLGFIFLGITSITEASAIGALGSLICAAVYRKLNWRFLHECLMRSARVIGMVMWICMSAFFFSKVYTGLGAPKLIKSLLIGTGLGRYGILSMFLLSYFILGMFLDDAAIMFITCPIYCPIIEGLGFDPVWFGLLYVISMESAYLTPPFGYNLFYMQGVAPPEVSIADIYRSVIPFVGLQLLGLAIVVIFPQIILFLPNLIFGVH